MWQSRTSYIATACRTHHNGPMGLHRVLQRVYKTPTAPPALGLHAPMGPNCRCHGKAARTRSPPPRRTLSAHPCTRFVSITSPQSSDRHSSVPAAAPCLKQRARRARATDGCLASTRSADLRRARACRCRGLRAARATSPLSRSSPAASHGTTHPQYPRRWGRRGRSLGHRGQWRKGVCRYPRLAAL